MFRRKHREIPNILNANEKENGNGKIVICKLKFINSLKFIGSPLSSLADNLAEELHKSKYKDCRCCLEYVTVNYVSLIFKCVDCNEIMRKSLACLSKNIWEHVHILQRRHCQFFLMLRKGVY